MSRNSGTRWSAEISRVTRSKAEARASYDRLSKIYDLLAGRSEEECREVGLQKLAAKKGETILEIGFGTGHGLLALARAVRPSGRVYGIDLSTGMCRVARARLAQAKVSENVVLMCGDAVALPYPARTFGAVFTSFTLELFDTPEIPRFLHECQRVLRGDGRICVVALSKIRVNVMTGLYEWVHAKFGAYADCRPIYAQAALEDAGFQTLDATEMSMWGLPIEVILAECVGGKRMHTRESRVK